MAKTKLDFEEKLKRLQQERDNLIAKRKEEIANVIDKANYLSVDDELLLGALLTIKEITETKADKHTTEQQQMLIQFKEKASKFFRKK